MVKGILGLEISSERIRYIYLKKKPRGFILSCCGVFSLEQDIAATKSPNMLAAAIEKILLKENISASKLYFSISGKNAFIHLIDLPKMSDSELREVIATEIEKIPSFSEEEFDYIYSAFKLNEQRMRVLFTAIAEKNLRSYIQAASQKRIYLESLEVSPLNLLGLLHSQLRANRSEALLVLDDHFSQLAIFSREGCGLFYTMSTGKEDLYPSGKQELDSSIFSAWTEEIGRAFRSYIREARRKGIEKLWFIWDNQGTQGLAKLINRQLGLQVTQPSPESFGIKLAVKQAEFNPIFFLSLAGPLTSLNRLKSMFFFEHFLQDMKAGGVIRKTGLAVILFIFLVGSVLGKVTINYISARKKISVENRRFAVRVADLQQRTAGLRSERSSYLDLKDKLLKQATFIRRLKRISPSEIFARIVSAAPNDVSFSSFELSESGTIKLKGSILKIDSLAEFIRRINAAGYFGDVKFNFLREHEREGIRIVEFDICTQLKPKINAQE